jgi:hypothetical protein
MTTKDKEEKEEVILQDDRLNNIPVITTTLKDKTPTPNDWIEKIAMNIVYQLDDDAKLSVEFRQANNDKRIDFVKGLIQSSLTQQKEAINKEWRERIEKAGKRLEIYCSDDTSRSVINMHGYNDGIKEIVKELIKISKEV